MSEGLRNAETEGVEPATGTSVQILNGDGGNATTKEFLWDPSEPVVTRSRFMKTPDWNLFYFHDGNKNISDLCFYSTANGVPAHYDYTLVGVAEIV